MKVFVPMSDEWPLDPTLAGVPLVPFQLDFVCQRDLDREGNAKAKGVPPPPAVSGGSPASRRA